GAAARRAGPRQGLSIIGTRSRSEPKLEGEALLLGGEALEAGRLCGLGHAASDVAARVLTLSVGRDHATARTGDGELDLDGRARAARLGGCLDRPDTREDLRLAQLVGQLLARLGLGLGLGLGRL